MGLDIALLKKISETPGLPGHEEPVRALLLSTVSSFCDTTSVDNVGNLICFKKGKDSSKKLMMTAHMDEIGFVITHIDDNGFLKFHTLGGFDPKTLTAQRVTVHGKKDLPGVMGSKPIHLMSADERGKNVKIEDFFIDLGLSKAEAEQYVEVGTPVSRRRSLIEMGECLNGKSLDNRISVYVLVEVIRQMSTPAIDFYAVFTVQEEVGLRGAQVAAHTINPDFGINIDTTIAFDVPGAKAEEKITSLGKGAGIKIMDSSVLCDLRMVKYLKQTAEKNQISWQPELLTAGGTDTSPLQRAGKNGSVAGAVSVPTRHIHQVIEMVNKNDVLACVQLLTEAAQNLSPEQIV